MIAKNKSRVEINSQTAISLFDLVILFIIIYIFMMIGYVLSQVRIKVRIKGHFFPKRFYIAKHGIIFVFFEMLTSEFLVFLVVFVGRDMHLKSSGTQIEKHIQKTTLGHSYLLKSERDISSRTLSYFCFLLNSNWWRIIYIHNRDDSLIKFLSFCFLTSFNEFL